MSRKIRFIAIALAFSALMAASAQAAPTRVPSREPAVDTFSNAWTRLLSWVREVVTTQPGGIKFGGANSTSQLDPNGGH